MIAAQDGRTVQDLQTLPVQHCAACAGEVWVNVDRDGAVQGDAFGAYLYRSEDDARIQVLVLDDGSGVGRFAS